LRRRLAELFGLDLRSLALLRVGLGATLLIDLAVRAQDLRAHYTDFGILPRAELGLYTWRTVWNLHALASPSPTAVTALFALAAALAVALALGWHTRAATLGSWLLTASLQYRDPALVFGGDVMLRMLLFWGLFLPLGARFSLDARRHPGRAPRANHCVSVATFALLLQVALVYWFSVLNRTGPTWWDGRALGWALHFDTFATGLGMRLREHEAWLAPMTHVAIWFEALGPFLAFSPFATGATRTLAVFLFLGFHAVLGLLFHIGLFPAAFALAWIGILPGWFWRRLGARQEPLAPAGPGAGGASRAHGAVAATALVFVVLSNLSTVRDGALARLFPTGWDLPAQALWIDQLWGLFSPDPPRYDGWYVSKGVLADGRELDLHDPERPLSFEKPRVVSETMNIRWREFFFRLQRDRDDPRWQLYGRWLCRAWNERHTGPERLERALVYFVQETTPESGEPPRRGDILTLLAHECSDAVAAPHPPTRELTPRASRRASRAARRSIRSRPARPRSSTRTGRRSRARRTRSTA
jgi:hypothetical protein